MIRSLIAVIVALTFFAACGGRVSRLDLEDERVFASEEVEVPVSTGAAVSAQDDGLAESSASLQVEGTVDAYLEFRLSPDSPSGVLESGLQPVFVVDAIAHKGDFLLDDLLFKTRASTGGGVPWMLHLQDAITGISYSYDREYIFHGYGGHHAEKPELNGMSLYWALPLEEPVRIADGETVTFTLHLKLTDLALPFGSLRYQLVDANSRLASEDTLENLSSRRVFPAVTSHELEFNGTLNGWASYCDMLVENDDTFGYRGCCGAFDPYDEGLPPAGRLFKATEDSSVYYMGSDGKRYLFPSSHVLDSWYGSLGWHAPAGEYDWGAHRSVLFPEEDSSICNAVVQVEEDVMAQIPFGGSVLMRPGTYVVGTVDSGRYVVAEDGQLRLIPSNKVSAGLFGSSLGEDVLAPYPEAEYPVRFMIETLFAEYSLGEPIESVSTYDFLVEYYSADMESQLGITE